MRDAWVGHANTYCCECKQPPPSSKCFPAAAKIKLQNGRLMSMSELQIGDRVQTGMTSVTMSELLIGDRVQTGMTSVIMSELLIGDRVQ